MSAGAPSVVLRQLPPTLGIGWRLLRPCFEAGPGSATLVVVAHGCGDVDRRWMSEAECRRWADLRSRWRRRAFVTGRLLLRQALLRDEAGRPTDLACNSHGKPHVHGGPEFSLSHTTMATALASHAAAPIGLDIAASHWAGATRALIDNFAHPREAAALRAAGDAEFASTFLRCWTRKEALLKAMGCGFAGDPASVDVCMAEPAPLVDGDWRLVDLPLQQSCGLIAALALHRSVERICVTVIGCVGR